MDRSTDHFGENSIPKITMNTKPDNLMDALKGIGKIKADATQSSVKIKNVAEQGWDVVAISKRGIPEEKTVDQWNQRDAVRYFYTSYFHKFGQAIPGVTPYPFCYGQLRQLMDTLCNGLRLKDCPMPLVKEYMDFFYDRYADVLVSKTYRKHDLGMQDLVRNPVIQAFLKTKQAEYRAIQEAAEIAAVAVVQPPTSLLEDLENAEGINPTYFVSAYGVLLPINYLMLVKGQNEATAVAYVKKVVDRLLASKKGFEGLVGATKRHQPYPRWFPCLNAQDLLHISVELSDDVPAYNCLRTNASSK